MSKKATKQVKTSWIERGKNEHATKCAQENYEFAGNCEIFWENKYEEEKKIRLGKKEIDCD